MTRWLKVSLTGAFVLVIVISLVAAAHWRNSAATLAASATVSPVFPAPATTKKTSGGASKQRSTIRRRDIRGEFKAAADYAAYADSIRADALAGHADAQYFLSAALRYCQENLGRFFLRPEGDPRTLGEAQGRWANRPVWYQQEIVDIYGRCHGFLQDPARSGQLAESDSWLDRAAKAGYPLAQVTKAGLESANSLVLSASPAPSPPKPDAPTTDQIQALAMSAVKNSADPEVLFDMSGFVDESSSPTDSQGIVTWAWRLLACERGFDCSAQADWVRNECHTDPRCFDGETGEDYLTRNLGANVDQARRIASAIGSAIDSQNWDALPLYLWNSKRLWSDDRSP